MENNKDDVEIVLENKEPSKDEPLVIIEGEEDRVEAKKDELVNETDPNEAIKKLNVQLKKEREAREKAERLANHANQQARQAYADDHETKKQLVASAIDRLKTDSSIFTAQFAEAMSVNDYEKAAQIQQAMAVNATKLAELESGFEKMKVQPPPVPDSSQAKSELDKIIEAVDKQSPVSAKWLKNNREHLDNDKMIRKMFRAHEDALEDGIRADTDEYFEFIEDRLGLRKKEEKARQKEAEQNEMAEDSVMSAAAKPVRSVQPSPAPVERGNSRPNVIRLSREEAEMARNLGMTEKEYAMNKLALQKAGRM